MSLNQVNSKQIKDESVESQDIKDGSIRNIDIASNAAIHYSKLDMNGFNIIRSNKVVDEDYTVVSTDDIISVDTTNNDVTLIFPDPTTINNKAFIVKKISDLNVINIIVSNNKLIDDDTEIKIQYKNSAMNILSIGASYIII